MGKLLDKALAPEVLNSAWKRLRNDKAEWLPGLPRSAMEKDLVLHLVRLLQELTTGCYRPAAVRQFPVSKGDGKQRIISAHCLRDKLVQRTVLTVLEPIGEALFHRDSFAYRPGFTIDMAIARARENIRCGCAWLVDADICGFFDNIPHKPLARIIARAVDDKAVRRLIDQWLETGTPRTGLLQQRRGIPQGAIISPFLCNLYLTDFDLALEKQNLPFVRYADDFLIFSPDRKAAETALKFAARQLQKLGLELHERKTRVCRSGPGVVFLGRKLPRPEKFVQPARSR